MNYQSTPVNEVKYDELDRQGGHNPTLLEHGRPTLRPESIPPPYGAPSPAFLAPTRYTGDVVERGDNPGLPGGPPLPVTAKTGSKLKPAHSKKFIIAIAAIILFIGIGVGVGVGIGVSKGRAENNSQGLNNESSTPSDLNVNTTPTDTGKPTSLLVSSSTETSSSPTAGGIIPPTTSSSTVPRTTTTTSTRSGTVSRTTTSSRSQSTAEFFSTVPFTLTSVTNEGVISTFNAPSPTAD